MKSRIHFSFLVNEFDKKKTNILTKLYRKFVIYKNIINNCNLFVKHWESRDPLKRQQHKKLSYLTCTGNWFDTHMKFFDIFWNFNPYTLTLSNPFILKDEYKKHALFGLAVGLDTLPDLMEIANPEFK